MPKNTLSDNKLNNDTKASLTAHKRKREPEAAPPTAAITVSDSDNDEIPEISANKKIKRDAATDVHSDNAASDSSDESSSDQANASADDESSDQDSDAENSSEIEGGDENEDDNERSYNPDYNQQRSDDDEEDPDNPDPYADEPEYTADEILDWIDEKQIVNEDGEIVEQVDYEPIDFDHIKMFTDTSELRRVKEALLDRNLYQGADHIETIKELSEDTQLDIEDEGLLDDNLELAVHDGDEEAAGFFLSEGGNPEIGIRSAITTDSSEILEVIEPDIDAEWVTLAAEGNHLQALGYFLQQDFSNCYEIALDIGLKKNNQELIEAVVEHLDSWGLYDFILYVATKNNPNYLTTIFPILLEKFTLNEIWEELQIATVDETILNLFLTHALQFLATQKNLNSESQHLKQHFAAIQLQIKQGLYSPYPINHFKGDKFLAALRTRLYTDTELGTENKVAATMVGYSLSTSFRLFPKRSVYHPVPMRLAEKYFRSGRHPLQKFFSKDDSKDEKSGIASQYKRGGLGNIPQGPQRHTVSLKSMLPKSHANADLYDFFLAYKHNASAKVAQLCNSLTTIKVSSYHSYPCVMVYLADLPSPKQYQKTAWTPAEKEAWTELVISFFVGLVNHTAIKRGLAIELVRRSSFGFLSPTISTCGQSFRINMGLVPEDYIQIVVDCLKFLANVLEILKDVTAHQENLVLQLPNKGCFSAAKDAEYKEYKGTPHGAKNVMELTWSGVTKRDEGKKNRIQTGAVKLTSDLPVARAQFAIHVYNELSKGDDEKTNSDYRYVNAFLNALRWGFEQCHINGKKLTFLQKENTFLPLKVKALVPAKLVDKSFFSVIGEKILNIIDRYQAIKVKLSSVAKNDAEDAELMALRNSITNCDIEKFYLNLEKLNEILFAKAISINADPEPTYGSDSDIDDDESDEKGLCVSKVYGSKVITNHGMMAIMQSLETSAIYLKNPTNKSTNVRVTLQGAYYEAEKDLPKLKKVLATKDINFTKEAKLQNADIIVYDLNTCVTNGQPVAEPNIKDHPNIKVWIIDTTSSTIVQQNAWLKKFRQTKTAQVLFLVSSGLKNEQNGADKIPYGTIRFFTKDQASHEKIKRMLKGELQLASGLTHNSRRMLKALGLVPTNPAILRAGDEKGAASSSAAAVPALATTGLAAVAAVPVKAAGPLTDHKQFTQSTVYVKK